MYIKKYIFNLWNKRKVFSSHPWTSQSPLPPFHIFLVHCDQEDTCRRSLHGLGRRVVWFCFHQKGLFSYTIVWAHSHEARAFNLFFFFRFTSGLCPTYLICNIFFCFSVFCYDECTVRYKQTVTTLAHKASRKSLYWMQRKFMVSATVKIMQITNCSIIKM